MGIRVGILLFEGVEELDFVGPWEVFTLAAKARPELEVVTLAPQAGTLRCAKGLRVAPDHALVDAPPLDVLLVPGGEGTRREVDNRDLLAWIAKTAEGCRWVTSVCTGALLLCEARVAAGKRVTTHWAFVESLRERGLATVVDDVRYVRDGQVVTAAGISAGIDMALWLVGQLFDPALARTVQRRMQYEPAPPYAAEV